MLQTSESKENLTFDNLDDTSFYSFSLPDHEFDYQSTETATKAKSSKELILDLNCSTKNRIVASLISYSELLQGKWMSANDRNDLVKENGTLAQQLRDLPIKAALPNKDADEKLLFERNSKKIKCDKRQSLDSMEKDDQKPALIQNNLIFEITWKTRTQIIDLLICNHNFSVRYIDTISSDTKNSLIANNNKFISILLNLPVRVCSDANRIQQSNGDESSIKHSLENIAFRLQEIAHEQSSQRADLDQWLSAIKQEIPSSRLEIALKDLVHKEMIPGLEERLRGIIKEQLVLSSLNATVGSTNQGRTKSSDLPSLYKEMMYNTCSFSITGKKFVEQDSFSCSTCNLVGKQGICVGCVNRCHKGHEITMKPASKNFCDCGTAGAKCESFIKLPSR